MAGLSIAHRAALVQIIDTVPDRTLRHLSQAVSSITGERARELATMLREEERDRARRTRGFNALAPLFRPRADGVSGLTFPSVLLPRLWKIVAVGEADVLGYLDPRTDYADDDHRVSTVCARLFAAAAAAVRDQPKVVWPVSMDDPAGNPLSREPRLQVLAHVCDFGGLAHRALPSLKAWIGRPDADQIAELRLLLRDAASISDDGAQTLLEILFAHLSEAPLMLRLVMHASLAAPRDSFLSGSELAIFVDRLIEAAEVRAARVDAYRAGDPVEPLRADLDWIAQFLNETSNTMQIAGGSAWGKRVRRIRLGVSRTLGGLLGRVDQALDRALPMVRATAAGRIRREIPNLDRPIDLDLTEKAQVALDLVRVTRGLTGPFGCDGQRLGLMTDLTARLVAYADLALEEVHAGDAGDGLLAGQRVMMAAEFLERLERDAEGRAVRRRVAAAGLLIKGVSPKAA